MSKWSLSVSMISDPLKMGTKREVAQRDDASCSEVNTGRLRSVVLWVDSGIVTIPLFRVDVPSSSKSVRFGSQFSGMEPYDKVEGRKKF